MLVVVVGEIPRLAAIADDEQLHEAEQAVRVAGAGITAGINDLLHRAARRDLQRFQFDLHEWQTVDQEDNIVTVVTAFRIDAQLVDDLEGVLAPVPQVDELVVKRSAVFSLEGVASAQSFRVCEHVRGYNRVKKPFEFAICEVDPIKSLELLAKISLQGVAVAEIVAAKIFVP